MKLPYDETDPVQVACAWTSIVEPGDPAAGILREILGEQEGLRWILDPNVAPLPDFGDRQIPWKRCHERWKLRVAELDVAGNLRRLELLGGRLLPRDASGWPTGLGDLEEKEPFGLWILGEGPVEWGSLPAVSIVGSRASTSYGARLASQFGTDLAQQGIAVVSGGAYGIDAAAHRGALTGADSAPTVAVLCGGLGNLYPAGNTELFQKIRQTGLLVSEVPPHWRPARWRFLERNRLIAALAPATVVVEAGERSGAIATANRALDLGRTVAAVPGPVTSAASRGCHRLIQDGAALVTGASDIVELLGLSPEDISDRAGSARRMGSASRAPSPGLRPVERLVWDALPKAGQTTVRQIAADAGLSSDEADVALLGLKLLGLVENNEREWSRASGDPHRTT